MNIKRSLKVSFLGISLLLFSPALMFGQSEKGTIVGTVTDTNGAAVPNATVTIPIWETRRPKPFPQIAMESILRPF